MDFVKHGSLTTCSVQLFVVRHPFIHWWTEGTVDKLLLQENKSIKPVWNRSSRPWASLENISTVLLVKVWPCDLFIVMA